MEPAIAAGSIDDLVSRVSLHVPLPSLVHGYALPFVLLYGAWFYCWIFVYGVDEYLEAGWIVLAAIALLQILVSLSCYWSVHVRTFLTCANDPDSLAAVYAKVVPTPNNGSPKLVTLQKERVGSIYNALISITRSVVNPAVVSSLAGCSGKCRQDLVHVSEDAILLGFRPQGVSRTAVSRHQNLPGVLNIDR